MIYIGVETKFCTYLVMCDGRYRSCSYIFIVVSRCPTVQLILNIKLLFEHYRVMVYCHSSLSLGLLGMGALLGIMIYSQRTPIEAEAYNHLQGIGNIGTGIYLTELVLNMYF